MNGTKLYEVIVKIILKIWKDKQFFLSEEKCRAFIELWKVMFNLGLNHAESNLTDRLNPLIFIKLTECVGDFLSIQMNVADHDFNKKMAATPIIPNICSAKLSIINCLMNIKNDMSNLLNKRKILTALGDLLEYQCLDDKNPESALAPIIAVLNGLCRGNNEILTFFRKMLWGSSCDIEVREDDTELINMDPKQDENTNERITTVRNILIKHVTSLHITLKLQVSEFLFTLSNSDPNEYIKRTGFGNAIGLLVERGFPGFDNIVSKEVDLADLEKEINFGKDADKGSDKQNDKKDDSNPKT